MTTGSVDFERLRNRQAEADTPTHFCILVLIYYLLVNIVYIT